MYFSHTGCAQLQLARLVTEDESLAGLGTSAYDRPSVPGVNLFCSVPPSVVLTAAELKATDGSDQERPSVLGP